MKDKPIKGQALFSLNVGNAARNREQYLTPLIVTAVGRKYFTCKEPRDLDKSYEKGRQYHLDSWQEKSDYCAISVLYATEQEWTDTKEIAEICKLIGDSFEYGRNKLALNLTQLRTIKYILNGD